MQPAVPDLPEPLPRAHPSVVPVPAVLLAWARQTFDEAEYLDGVRQIESEGGVPFEEVIARVELVVRGSVADAFGTATVLQNGDEILDQVRVDRVEWDDR